MNSRPLVLTAIWLAAASLLVVGWRQQARIGTMRLEVASRATAGATAPPVTPQPSPGRVPPQTPPEPASAPAASALSEPEKLEVLRLRSEVTRLKERQRGLAEVRAENTALRGRLAAATTTTAVGTEAGHGPFAGYVRRKEAQDAGLATPEATLQTFLWAIEHEDANRLLAVLDETSASGLRRVMSQSGSTNFWNDIKKFPGYRITEVAAKSDSETTVRLEILPGELPQEMTFRRVGAEWRMRL